MPRAELDPPHDVGARRATAHPVLDALVIVWMHGREGRRPLHILGGVAKHLPIRGAGVADDALGVNDGDEIGRVRREGTVALLRGGEGTPQPLLACGVLEHHDHPDDAPARIAYRHGRLLGVAVLGGTGRAEQTGALAHVLARERAARRGVRGGEGLPGRHVAHLVGRGLRGERLGGFGRRPTDLVARRVHEYDAASGVENDDADRQVREDRRERDLRGRPWPRAARPFPDPPARLSLLAEMSILHAWFPAHHHPIIPCPCACMSPMITHDVSRPSPLCIP